MYKVGTTTKVNEYTSAMVIPAGILLTTNSIDHSTVTTTVIECGNVSSSLMITHWRSDDHTQDLLNDGYVA